MYVYIAIEFRGQLIFLIFVIIYLHTYYWVILREQTLYDNNSYNNEG